MPDLLAPELTREHADSLRRVLDRRQEPGLSLGDAEFLLSSALVDVDLSRRMWTLVRQEVSAGMEGASARRQVEAACQALQASAASVQSTLQLAEAVGQRHQTEVGGVAQVREALAEVARLVDAARTLLGWLDEPLPPIDAERLARGVAAARRGEVQPAGDVVARLKGGNP
jgi:hypothetical protein